MHVSPDLYLASMPGMEDYLMAANGLPQDRFIFGTCYPFRPVHGRAEWYQTLGLSDEVLEKTMYRNAARILGPEG